MANNSITNNPKENPMASIVQILTLAFAPNYIKQTPEFTHRAERCSQDVKTMLLRETSISHHDYEII